MRLLLATVPVAVGAILVILLGAGGQMQEPVFHVTLATPSQYVSGVYRDEFLAPPGRYSLAFVPNGDSPGALAIHISGPGVTFAREYILEGTLHDTGISTYYTWEYSGDARLDVSYEQRLNITIDPRGNTLGPVSVSLVEE